MDKRNLLVVFLSQFDLTSRKMEEILNFMKTSTIECFAKTKFPKEIIKPDSYQTMLASADEKLTENYVKNLADRDIFIVTIFDEDYPEKLRQMNDSPFILYYKGDLSLASKPALSVVGTRKPSAYGKMATEKIVSEVASAGVVIVSGLAYGIDSIAHRKTLEVGGKTIAVLGSGFDNVYPSQHQSLADEIARKGLLISEQRPKKGATKYLFPLRNRIIAALGQGTLITEAGIKSGTVHTKDYALDFGRDVFALPGNINSPNSDLPNEVIKTGQGMCVTCGKDILNLYNIKPQTKQMTMFDNLSADEEKIVNLLKDGIKDIDYLTKNVDFDISNFNTCLTMLEIRGIITRMAGGQISLN